MRRMILAIGLIAFTALACSDPESVLPTSPTVPGVSVIEISGPATIAPGQSIQLTALIVLADGTKKLSSPNTSITWTTSSSILQVSSTGLLSASQVRGEARVTVRIGTGTGSRQASRDFIVLPDGTYRLVGTIRDTESPTFPLTGVQVEVPEAGLVTTTDSEGQYRLYGVPPTAIVQVSKTGYTAISQPLQLTTHATRDFQLVLAGSRVILNGYYTLTLDMPAGCTGDISADLRRRSYEATVTQAGAVVEVILTEPRFRVNHQNRGNRFTGYADSERVTFTLGGFDSYFYPTYSPFAYPAVAERLADGSILVPSGHAVVVRAGAGLSGGFNAWFDRYASNFPTSNMQEWESCRSPATQLTLMPR